MFGVSLYEACRCCTQVKTCALALTLGSAHPRPLITPEHLEPRGSISRHPHTPDSADLAFMLQVKPQTASMTRMSVQMLGHIIPPLQGSNLEIMPTL